MRGGGTLFFWEGLGAGQLMEDEMVMKPSMRKTYNNLLTDPDTIDNHE